MLPVFVTRKVLQAMRRHARSESPLECCGLLSGRQGVIDRATPAANQRKSPTAFAVPPEELISFFKRLRRDSEEFMGIYHSHPFGQALPSQRDVDEFSYPEVSYWILGQRLEIHCYRWDGSGFQPHPFKIADEAGKFENIPGKSTK